MENKAKRKVTMVTRIGYGMGGFIGGGGLSLAHTWLLFFYTAFCNLNAWQAALIFSIATYLDMIENPLIGFLSDNFNSTSLGKKFGRRRFFLLVSIPFLMLYPLVWLTGQNFIYYMLTYIIYDFVDNVFNVAYGTLRCEMTEDYNERQFLSGALSIGGQAAGFINSGLPVIFFLWLGKNNPHSYQAMVIAYSLILVISALAVYLTSWELPVNDVKVENIDNFWEGLKKLFHDIFSTFRIRTFRWHIGMYIFGSGGLWLFSAITTFFYIYVLNKSTVFASGLGTALKPVELFSTFLAIWLCAKMKDTAKPYIMGLIGVIVSMLAYSAIWFFGLNQSTALIVVAAVILELASGICYYVPSTNYVYMPDIDEIVTNRRREGVYSGAQGMAGKVMRGTVVLVAGIVLSKTGFVKGLKSQPISAQIGIVMMMLIGICGLTLLAIWCSRHMKADEKSISAINTEIKRVHNGGRLADATPETKALVKELTGFDYEHCFGNNNVGYKEKNTSTTPPTSALTK